MYAVIEVQDTGENVATLTTQFSDYAEALNKFHTVMSYAAVSNLKSHGAVLIDNSAVIRSDYVQREITFAYPRTSVSELSEDWLAETPMEVEDTVVIMPEQQRIYILEANSTSYRQGDKFRWNGQSYVQI